MSPPISSLRQTPEFLRGRDGEQKVAGMLQDAGWWVIRSYDYTGEDGDKAPKLSKFGCAFAIPDLDISQAGRRVWVEVKTKTRPNIFRNAGGRAEHGIDLRAFQDYLEVEKITGTDVYLFVAEENSGAILFARLQALNELPDFDEEDALTRVGGYLYKRVYRGPNHSPMINWPREAFLDSSMRGLGVLARLDQTGCGQEGEERHANG